MEWLISLMLLIVRRKASYHHDSRIRPLFLWFIIYFVRLKYRLALSSLSSNVIVSDNVTHGL